MSIDLCINNNLHVPALILIYTGIDIASSIDPSSDTHVVTRDNFIKWCKTYLLADQKLECSAIDLYAARCALIHSSTPYSNLSEKGNAKLILYTCGNKKADDLNNLIKTCDLSISARTVHIETFAKIFKIALVTFIEEVSKSPEKVRIINKKSKKVFANISKFGTD